VRISSLVSLVLCLTLIGSAIDIAPSGGEKDITPPRVLNSEPSNYSTNFTGEEVVIEFDEYIELKDLYNNFITSPPLAAKPEIVIRGKAVVMKFDGPLPSHSTFNFNFGNSIVDIHEGNPIEDYQFVISTDSFVDSMTLEGRVINASSLEPAKDVWVTLYECQDYESCDSLPSKELPKYLARTGKEGLFQFRNIKEGAYKVFALVDKNRNYLFDLPNESIGFVGNLVEAGDSSLLSLSTFDQEDGNQKITKVWTIEPGSSKIAFKLPVDQLEISALNYASKTRWEVVGYNAGRDTVSYWNTSGMDSLRLHIRDSRYSFEDTVTVESGQKKELSRLAVLTNVSRSKVLDIGETFRVVTSKPLTIYDEQSIKLFERIDSVTLSEVEFKINYADKTRKTLNLAHDWKPGMAYRLKLETEAFADLFGGKSDSLAVNFSVGKEEYYGNIAVEITFPETEHAFIVQLLNARGSVSRENFIQTGGGSQNLTRKLDYQHVTPGKYRLKVVYDTNNNGRWDTGNHAENRQPERIAFSKDDILIRANWDQVLDWTLDP
jgi:uncharacterized protein (DUF2141 family)